jgi:hypothetical protein
MVERTHFRFLGQDFYQADYGGQIAYRESYLANPDRFLTGVDLVAYVYDCQDSGRQADAEKYFKAILEHFRTTATPVPVIVLLHKIDPDSEGYAQQKKAAAAFREAVADQEVDFVIHYFETSIFSLPSIVKAMSFAVRELFTEGQLLESFLEELADKFENFVATLLFEESGISLGEVYSDHLTIETKMNILRLYESAQRRLFERNQDLYEFSEKIDPFTRLSGAVIVVRIYGVRFLIMIVVHEDDEATVINQLNWFEGVADQLTDVLQNILVDTDDTQRSLGNV